MSFFADKVQNPFNQYKKALTNVYQNIYYPALASYIRYVAPNLSVSGDLCNLAVAYKPPLSTGEIGIVNAGIFNLPRIEINIRNPFCTLPNISKPAPAGMFKLPGKCISCNAIVAFGCTVIDNNPSHFVTQPGMSFLEYLATNTIAPIGVAELNFRGSQPFPTQNGKPNVFEMGGTLNGKFLDVYYCSVTLSQQQQLTGYVDTATLPTRPDGTPINWGLIDMVCLGCEFQPTIDPPPPQSIEPSECECMCNDQLMKLVLQRIGNLPASVPDNFASKTPKQITLDSLAEILIWQAQQMDALAGQYPIPLTIKADPTDPKSKDQQISLPNQAETLAEILGLLIVTKRDTHAALIGVIKTLGEIGMTKNLAVQTYDIAHANAEFLGYKLEQVSRTIPCLFTPNGQSLAETFKETNTTITSYENKDTTDLQDDLKALLTMAARWNAQNWRAVGANAAVSLAKNFIGNVEAVANTHEAIKEETFGQFIQEVQQGFTRVAGVTDTLDPWGNPISEAPVIRQLGVTAETAADEVRQAAVTQSQTGQKPSLGKDVLAQQAISEIGSILSKL
ncbi:MAG: hypothetical protein V7K86_05605 [Nostoc sp.]|uniref:hypothetical protein n=1 Tax=Nostoc sp. TaxID=1180 RepID=UPI002FFCD5A5